MVIDKPIEIGWQMLYAEMPEDLSPQAAEVLRHAFFAGASRYRAMVKELFEPMDTEERVRLLANLIAEIDEWENEEELHWIKGHDQRGISAQDQ